MLYIVYRNKPYGRLYENYTISVTFVIRLNELKYDKRNLRIKKTKAVIKNKSFRIHFFKLIL